MKSIFATVIGAAAVLAIPGFSISAQAADIPARMPAKVEAFVPAAYDWSGIYTATSIGVGWDNINGSTAGGATANTSGTHGWMGSHIGYQHMWGNWVLGVEGSYSTPFTSKSDNTAGGTADCTAVGAGFSCNSRINDIWTVGGKAGYAMGNWMVYGAGGYANGRIEETTSLGGIVGSGSKANHSGWYAGAGVDWYVTRFMWSDLILGVEYRHIALDDKLHNDIAGPAFNKTFNADVDTVMLKATFKWVGAGPFSIFK